MISSEWELSQQNEIKFVLVDSSGNEVSGLGATFTLELSKPGDNAFVASSGTKSELGSGWYRYLSTAAEADTAGALGIKVTGVGVIQQNLEYVVKSRNILAEYRDYQVVESDGTPIEGAVVQVSTDLAGTNIIWSGNTDATGYAVDDNGNKPFLEPGTYYFWRYRSGYTFDNPDTEVFT